MDWVRGNPQEFSPYLMDSNPMAWLTTRPKRKTAKVRQMAVAFNTFGKGSAKVPLWSSGKSSMEFPWFHLLPEHCECSYVCLYIYRFSIIHHAHNWFIRENLPEDLVWKHHSWGLSDVNFPEKNPGPSDYHHRRYWIESQVLKNRNVL